MPKILLNKSNVDLDYPICRPSLDLDFTQEVLDERITFSRGSIGTRVNRNRLIETVPANQPRFDYDPVTGECKGLLIEESRTNLVKNNTAQGAVVGTTTPPTNSYVYIAPSGINWQVASVGTENGISYFDIRFYGVSASSGELSWASQTATNTPITGGQVVSGSVYLKYVSGTFANISSLSVRVLDYNGASYLTESSTAVSTSSLQSSTLQRYSHTRTTSASADGVVFSITLNKTSAGPIDITLRIGMPQVEVGSFPTSVIPTSGSTVTRSADVANMTGSNFSSWYNSSEGSVYSNTRMNGVQTGRYDRLWAITNSNLNFEGISVYVAGPAGVSGAYLSSITITNSATEQIIGTQVESAITTPNLKSAFAFATNNSASAYNGNLRFVDKSVILLSNPDRLLIGQPQRFQGTSCMTISRLTYYPRALKPNQLQLLTQ